MAAETKLDAEDNEILTDNRYQRPHALAGNFFRDEKEPLPVGIVGVERSVSNVATNM